MSALQELKAAGGGRYDYLIVGAGFAGSVLAERLASQHGARILLIGPRDIPGALALPAMPDFRLAPIVALEFVYAWLARSSKALGRDPDHPKTLLNKIIKTT